MRKLIWFCVTLMLSSGIMGLVGCGGDSEEELEDVKSGPSIFSIIPENGAKGVPTTAAIVVVFGEDINTPSSGNLIFTPGASGEVSYDSDSHTLMFRPSSDLSDRTDYSLTLEGIAGLDGELMSPVTISFTTSVPDTQRPKIESTLPEDGQKDIAHGTDIVIRFSEPMDRIKLRDSISFDPRVDLSLDEWMIEWTVGNNEEAIISSPAGSNPFDVNKEYTLTLSKDSVMDLSGNSLVRDYDLSFRTLKYPVEDIGNLTFGSPAVTPLWMYIVGKVGGKWVVVWGGARPNGAPSQNSPSGTITASADGEIQDDVETFAGNANNAFTPTVTKGDGNRLTFQTVNLNNNRRFRMIFNSTSSYLIFDLRSSAGTIPSQYVHIGKGFANPSRTPFIMKNK